MAADYNWFGNNASNYNIKPEKCNADIGTWLFLNATADLDMIPVFDSSDVEFRLSAYNESARNISVYDNSLLMPVNLSISSQNGHVDAAIINLGDSVRYTATGLGGGSVTASIENVTYAIELDNIKADSNLSVNVSMIAYGENAVISLDYNPNASGKINITLTGIKYAKTYENIDLNDSVLLCDDILPDVYDVAVAYSGDEYFNNAAAYGSFTVNKAATSISSSDISTTYNINRNLVITLKDATGKALSGVNVTVDLNGAKTYATDKNGQVKLSTKGLAPNKYAAKITFNGDSNHDKSTKSVTVIVKKAKPKIIAKKKNTYRAKAKTKKLKITLKDNTGKPIKNAKVSLILKKIGKGSKKKTKIIKTNKKGKATFKVKINKKAKYLAYVKFYANKYYKKTVKKIKITIK